MSTIRLVDPWWLLLIVPLAVATSVAVRRERRISALYSSSRLLDHLPVTLAQRCQRFLPWMRVTGLLLVVVALARPQAGLSQFRIRTEGIALVMCLDRSGSMEALDFQLGGERVNRLAVVKRVFRDFIAGTGKLPGRPDDLIGLVTFGGYAEGIAPLTFDHGALLQMLGTVQIAQPVYDSAGRVVNERYLEEERATAIGDAVTLAVDRLRDSSAKSKAIILLSDGENTAGIVDPAAAAEAAKTFGIKIYAIGIGTTGRVPFPASDRDPFGRQRFIARPVRLDETTLKMLAQTTGGQYFNAQDTEALENVYAAIDQLEKSESEGILYSEYRELFPWWLVPGLVLICGEFILRHTRLRTWP
jgi:Ca-activated chloride channel family protein